MKNFEKIKAMSVDELALFLDNITNDCLFCPAFEFCGIGIRCNKAFEEWLKSEVKQ